MFYLLHEMQHAMFAPLRLMASAGRAFHTHAANPWSYLPYGRAVAAGCELVERMTRRYDKPAFGLSHVVIGGEKVSVTETVAVEKPFCNLLHFERAIRRHDPKLLLVAPMSGHHATLLRGTVESLLPEHDIYLTDWLDARTVPASAGPFHLDDYVTYIGDFLRFLGPDTHVIAVCQPAVPVVAAISLAAAHGQVAARSMTLIGGPIDTRRSPTKINQFAKQRPLSWFRQALIHRVPPGHPGAGRAVYPGFLQLAGFVSLNVPRHGGSHRKFLSDVIHEDDAGANAHRKFYDEYNAVMDMPGEYYLETIRAVFQEHDLPRGVMAIRGETVNPAAVRHTALLTIEGEADDICGLGQTEAAHDLFINLPAALRQHYLVENTGHYGIFSGSVFREQIAPRIRGFIRRHDRASERTVAALPGKTGAVMGKPQFA